VYFESKTMKQAIMTRRFPIRFFFLFASLLSALLFRCGSDELENTPQVPNGPNVPETPGTPISDEARLKVLDECRSKAEELDNLKDFEDKVQFVAWLYQNSAFSTAGLFPGSFDVYAMFTDGRIALFTDTPKTDEPYTGGRIRGESDKGSRLTEPTSTLELPKSTHISLFNGMGKYFNDNTEALEKIITASGVKYQVNRKTASIKNLEAVNGDGVFYLFTHGGGGAIPNPPPKTDSTFVMSLWTTDKVTKENDQAYKAYLDDKRLAYMLSTFDTDKPEWHYGITGEFIKKHMTFGENALIYIDACNGFRLLPTGTTFRNTVVNKAANKKATYIGWTMETNEFMASQASQFIFDRLLGANTTGYGPVPIPKEDPVQRPFDIDRIFSDLTKRGFHLCANGATLKYETNVDEDILLTPTIERLEMFEYTSTLEITGSFGSKRGKVTVDGKEISQILDWTPTVINCIIPENGAGSAGDVIVSVEDRKSNPVPLTVWNVKLNYASDDNGVRMEGSMSLVIRADMHPRREMPGEKPSLPELVDYGPRGGNVFGNTSSATYLIGGQKFATCKLQECTGTFTESPLAKSGTVNYFKVASNVPTFTGFYNWSTDRKTIRIDHLAISLPQITTVAISQKYKCPGGDEEQKDQIKTTFGFSLPTEQITDVIQLQIADNYNIRAGSFSKTIPRPWSPCDGSGSYSVLVTWDLVRPSFAPTDDTPARLRAPVGGN
jgi:hypothetical protein